MMPAEPPGGQCLSSMPRDLAGSRCVTKLSTTKGAKQSQGLRI